MPVHPIDFEIQANIYATPELKTLYDEEARIQRWLDFEGALATVQGELGIIPKRAAAEISGKAKLKLLDMSLLTKAYQESRNSLLPVIKALRHACQDNWGEFVHYGATTQDVLDTAQVLELKEVLRIIYRDLRVLEGMLLAMARTHQSTPMIGRTHGQQALPITFGLKVITWATEIRRHIERIKSMTPRVLVGQLSGAVGTMAALGPRAREVAPATLARLGLGAATVSWHTSRDNMAEVATCFGMLASSIEKISGEIFQLGRTELQELSESGAQKGMSSSTMPHKQNPVFCQRIAVLGSHVRSLAGLIMTGMVHEHERDPRALWSEWLAMPQISIYTGTTLHYINAVIKELEIRPKRMLDNLHLQKDMVASEWLLYRLAGPLGKMSAQEKLHDLIRQADSDGLTLKEALQSDQETGKLLTAADLDHLEKPEHHVGHAVEIVEAGLEELMTLRSHDPENL